MKVLTKKRSSEIAKLVLEVILLMPNLVRVETYFNFGLPNKDPDDQKFTDCAIACGAAYLVTADNDFKEVEKSPFPALDIVSPEALHTIFEKVNG